MGLIRLLWDEQRTAVLTVLLAVPRNILGSCWLFHDLSPKGVVGANYRITSILCLWDTFFHIRLNSLGAIPMMHCICCSVLTGGIFHWELRSSNKLPQLHSWVFLRISCLIQMFSSSNFPSEKWAKFYLMTFGWDLIRTLQLRAEYVCLRALNSYSTFLAIMSLGKRTER